MWKKGKKKTNKNILIFCLKSHNRRRKNGNSNDCWGILWRFGRERLQHFSVSSIPKILNMYCYTFRQKKINFCSFLKTFQRKGIHLVSWRVQKKEEHVFTTWWNLDLKVSDNKDDCFLGKEQLKSLLHGGKPWHLLFLSEDIQQDCYFLKASRLIIGNFFVKEF